jgi:hypothetical protein
MIGVEDKDRRRRPPWSGGKEEDAVIGVEGRRDTNDHFTDVPLASTSAGFACEQVTRH